MVQSILLILYIYLIDIRLLLCVYEHNIIICKFNGTNLFDIISSVFSVRYNKFKSWSICFIYKSQYKSKYTF